MDVIVGSVGFVPHLFRDNGFGALKAAESFPTHHAGAYVMAAADLNGDGYPDLASAHGDEECVWITLNEGGAFGASLCQEWGLYQPGCSPYHSAVIAVDIDGDDDRDLVQSWFIFKSLGVGRNKGDGSFETPFCFPIAGAVLDMVAADVDEDGDLDLITIGWDQVARVFLTGDGHLVHAASYPAGGYWRLAYGDLTGDGLPEVATTSSSQGFVAVLRNTGSGFDPPIVYPVGPMPHEVVIADLTGDGHNELIVSVQGTGSVVVFPGQPGGQIGTPVDGDGLVGQRDLAALLAVYDTCVGAPDFNPKANLFAESSTGKQCVNQSDLGVLLSVYGQACPGG
jgi:hypothetical protein